MTFEQLYQLLINSPLLLGLLACGFCIFVGMTLLLLKGHQGKVQNTELKFQLSLIAENARVIKKGLNKIPDKSSGFHFEEMSIPPRSADVPEPIVEQEIFVKNDGLDKTLLVEESNLHIPKDIAALCRELEKNLMKKS